MWWDMVGGINRHWLGWVGRMVVGRKDGGGMGVQWVEWTDGGWFRWVEGGRMGGGW